MKKFLTSSKKISDDESSSSFSTKACSAAFSFLALGVLLYAYLNVQSQKKVKKEKKVGNNKESPEVWYIKASDISRIAEALIRISKSLDLDPSAPFVPCSRAQYISEACEYILDTLQKKYFISSDVEIDKIVVRSVNMTEGLSPQYRIGLISEIQRLLKDERGKYRPLKDLKNKVEEINKSYLRPSSFSDKYLKSKMFFATPSHKFESYLYLLISLKNKSLIPSDEETDEMVVKSVNMIEGLNPHYKRGFISEMQSSLKDEEGQYPTLNILTSRVERVSRFYLRLSDYSGKNLKYRIFIPEVSHESEVFKYIFSASQKQVSIPSDAQIDKMVVESVNMLKGLKDEYKMFFIPFVQRSLRKMRGECVSLEAWLNKLKDDSLNPKLLKRGGITNIFRKPQESESLPLKEPLDSDRVFFRTPNS